MFGGVCCNHSSCLTLCSSGPLAGGENTSQVECFTGKDTSYKIAYEEEEEDLEERDGHSALRFGDDTYCQDSGIIQRSTAASMEAKGLIPPLNAGKECYKAKRSHKDGTVNYISITIIITAILSINLTS